MFYDWDYLVNRVPVLDRTNVPYPQLNILLKYTDRGNYDLMTTPIYVTMGTTATHYIWAIYYAAHRAQCRNARN